MELRAQEPGLFCIRWRNKMSYINEALKKAQKDKDANRMGYIRSIGKSGSIERSFDKKFLYLFFIIIVLVALLLYLNPDRKSKQDLDIKIETRVNMPAAADDKKNNTLPVTDEQPKKTEDLFKIDSIENEIVSQSETRYTQGASLFKEGKLQDAEGIYREILEKDPGHINSLNDMGVLSLHEGRYEDAINFLEKAVKLKPKFANPYYNLACAYSLKNEGDKGMAYLLKAIEVDEKVKDWAKEDPDLVNLKEYAEFTVITE